MNAETQTVELCETVELSDNTEVNHEDKKFKLTVFFQRLGTTWFIINENLSYETFRQDQKCPS